MQKDIGDTQDGQEAKGKYIAPKYSTPYNSVRKVELTDLYRTAGYYNIFIFDPVVSVKRSLETTSEYATDIPKSKRPRITFTQDQMTKLLCLFKTDKYPDLFTQRNIAESLGLTPTNVYNWFQNKRAKEKKVAAKHHEPFHQTAGPIMQPQQFTPLLPPSVTYNTSSATIVQSEITAISPSPPSSTITYPVLSPWTAHSGSLPVMYPPTASASAIFPYLPSHAPVHFPPFNELIPPP